MWGADAAVLVVTGLFLIFALTAATAYVVAQEFAYVAADRGRLRQLAAGGDRAAQRALTVTGRLSFLEQVIGRFDDETDPIIAAHSSISAPASRRRGHL